MIDFRYHLVSLVSVFLALAVGIVLGAGPLKESIGTTLNQQVQSLREEKDGLRVQLGTANSAVAHRDDFTTAVTSSLVSGQLANRSVALVTLPEVDGDVIDPLVAAITTAGGTVTAQVNLNSAWADPAKAGARSKAVSDLTEALPAGSVPRSGEDDVRLANLLAGALVSPAAGATTDQSSTVLDALKSADLIGIKGNVTGLASGALMVTPVNATDGPAVATTPVKSALASIVSLTIALDTMGGGAVVTGPASAATDDGVLGAIRKDDRSKSTVSTVDTGSTPMGVVTAVLALREQLSGGSGAYGFGSGAGDLLPAPAVAPAASPTAKP